MTTTVSPSDSAQAVTYIAATADLTLDRNDSPAVVSNIGATGTVSIILPQDAKGGEKFTFVRSANAAVQINPGAAGAIYYIPNSGSWGKATDDKYVQLGSNGAQIVLIADGNGDWVSTQQAGTNTTEA